VIKTTKFWSNFARHFVLASPLEVFRRCLSK